MTMNVTSDEIRRELQERKRSLLEENRERAIAEREAGFAELRTTKTMYVSANRSAFKFRSWLDTLHNNGAQLVEIRGVVVVAFPDTDALSGHGQKDVQAREGKLGPFVRPWLDAMQRAGDLDHVPPCDVCGDREAQYPDASLQLVLCGDPKCRIGRRGATGSRKSSSK